MKTSRIALLIFILILANQNLRAAQSGGQIVGWGANSSATGTSFIGNSTGLVTVAGTVLSNVIQIAAGRNHGLALKADGTVVGWGANEAGQINVPEGLSNVIAISAGHQFSLALKRDGHVIAWGSKQFGQSDVPIAWSNAVAIAAGEYSSLVLIRDGRVFSWPGNNSVVEGLSNVMEIALDDTYYNRNLALKSDGTVVLWGSSYGMPPSNLSNVVSIALGANHGLALKSNGTVFGWGANYSGQATGTPISTAVDHTASGLVTLGGQVLKNVTAIAAGKDFSMALKRDGTVVTWGFNPYQRIDVPAGLSNVVAIAAGKNFCLAITTNSAVADKFRH